MSFFDEGDQPSSARTRRAASRTPRSEDEAIRNRRIAAGVGGVIVLLILIFAIKGCVDNRKDQAFKDYARNASTLVQESDTQVGKPFFTALSSGATPLNLEQQVNQLRAAADGQVSRAKKLDTPGDMAGAQRNLITTLEFRRDGLAKIAAKLRTALGKVGASAAVDSIAAQMQLFLASDALYAQRVRPNIIDALDSRNLDEPVRTSRFLPSLDWLSATYVSDQLSVQGGTKGGPVAPGTHGFGLVSTSVGTTTLVPGTENRVAAGTDVTFTVKAANQGENDETDVTIRITVTGGPKVLKAERTINSVPKGQTATAEIPLGSAPPIGQPVTVKAEVVPVPGEKKTDNNKSSYPTIFTR